MKGKTMKKRLVLLVTLSLSFVVSVSAALFTLITPKTTVADGIPTAAENFSMGSVAVNTTASYSGNPITKRTVWLDETIYTPSPRKDISTGEYVQGATLYGYQLKSNSVYTDNVGSRKYYDKTSITLNGYYVPGNHQITTSIDQTINTDNDVEFYMSPMVASFGRGGSSWTSRFYMVLSDANGTVNYNGFSSTGNFLSMSFTRNPDRYMTYSAADQNYESWIYVGGKSDTYGTGVPSTSTGKTATNGLNKALYSMPVQGWGNYPNYLDADAYEKSERLVKVNYHFFNDGEDKVTITLTSVYKDNIDRPEHYTDNEITTSYTYTASLSDYGLSNSSNMKLYFGYSNVHAGWFSANANYAYTDDGDAQGTPGSEAYQREIPMGLQLYNYSNGIKGVSAVKNSVKVDAGGSYDLTKNVAFTRYAGDTESDPTFTFVSDNADFSVSGNTLNTAATAKGYATITATAEGKSCSFRVWTDDNFDNKATYSGNAGTLGADGVEGSVVASAVSNGIVDGYKATGTAYYYGWRTQFTYAVANPSDNMSFLLEPNYESSGPGGQFTNETKCRRVHVELKGATQGTASWDIYAPWAGGTPDRIFFHGAGQSSAVMAGSTGTNYVKAFYAGYNSNYYFKVEIVPNGSSSQLVFSAVNKTTLEEDATKFTHTFSMTSFTGNVSLSVSYYTNNSDVDIADANTPPERERITNLNFGIYNFINEHDINFDGFDWTYNVNATYSGSAGTLGEGGTAGSVSVNSVSNETLGLYGKKATGTAYYYGWKTEFTLDNHVDASENVSFLLEPNYESSGPGGVVFNTSTLCRRVHIEMAGANGGAIAWNLFAPWAGGTPEKIRFNGTGADLKDTASNTNYVKAFYADNNSDYFFKVEIIPDGSSSQLVFSAVDKTTLEEDETKFTHTFTMPNMSGEVSLSVSYFTNNSGVDIADANTPPERERITNLNFGVYNYQNGVNAWSGNYTAVAKYSCSYCGEVYKHDAIVTRSFVHPTPSAQGSLTYTATYDDRSDTKVKAINLSFVQRQITIGKDITLIVYAGVYGTDTPTLNFDIADSDADKLAVGELDGDYYVFTCKIAPQNIGKDIVLTLTGADGERYITTTSVAEYINDVFTKTAPSDELKELMARLLAYSDAATNYKGGTGTLLTDYADIAAVLDGKTDYTPVNSLSRSVSTETGTNFKSANVVFGSTNSLIVKFKTDSTANLTVEIDGERVHYSDEGSGVYSVTIKDIYAYEFDVTHTFTLKRGGETVQTLDYDMSSYVYSVVNGTKYSTEYKALAQTLYNYGSAATACLD